MCAASAADLSALEYIPPKTFIQSLTDGKIKTDVCYWTNALGNQTLVPQSKTGADGSVLEISGGELLSKKGHQNQYSLVYRVIPIIDGKEKVLIRAEINYSLDLWAKLAPEKKARPYVSSFFVNGSQVSGDVALEGTESQNNAWGKVSLSAPIPPGSKLLVVKMFVPRNYLAKFRNIEVEFF